MPVRRAFSLEAPAVELTWGLTEQGVSKLLRDHPVKRITAGHLLIRARVLFGLEHEVHLFFHDRPSDGLSTVELIRTPHRERQRGYDEWQARLVRLLGKPSTDAGPDRFHPAGPADRAPYSSWSVGHVRVVHEWYYQGVEYERMRFTTTP